MLFMNQDKKNAWPSGLSLTLVGIQFVLIGVIAFTKPLWPPDWRLRGILVRGGVVGLWALQVMGLRQVKVFPEVGRHGSLIVLGPYRWAVVSSASVWESLPARKLFDVSLTYCVL